MIYFVSPSGNDGSAGTMDSPWKTLENSVNKLSAGDILYIRNSYRRPLSPRLCKKVIVPYLEDYAG